ncbi:MAG: PilZ domain-containing protein [Gammaproteobacteria bacterium]
MSNKRRFPREQKAESLSLMVTSSAHMLNQGERLYCESVDISPTGLQVILDRLIERDSKVELWMVLLENRQTYQLRGRVTWVEGRMENGRERFHAGVQLLPAADSDFDRWLLVFDND